MLSVVVAHDELFRLGQAALDSGYILQPEHGTGERVGADDLAGYLILARVRYIHPEFACRLILSAYRTQALQQQLCLQGRGRESVGCHTRQVERDYDLFALAAEDLQFAHRVNLAQLACEPFGVRLQLRHATLVALQRQQDRCRIAEIVDKYHIRHACRQLGLLEQVQSGAHLCPGLILGCDGVAQHDIAVHHPILGGGVCHLPVNLLIRIDERLKRYGHLLLHLLCRCARIDSRHYSLTDSELRKLILAHLRQRPDAECHQHSEHEEDDTVVAQSALYMIAFVHYLLSTTAL